MCSMSARLRRRAHREARPGAHESVHVIHGDGEGLVEALIAISTTSAVISW